MKQHLLPAIKCSDLLVLTPTENSWSDMEHIWEQQISSKLDSTVWLIHRRSVTGFSTFDIRLKRNGQLSRSGVTLRDCEFNFLMDRICLQLQGDIVNGNRIFSFWRENHQVHLYLRTEEKQRSISLSREDVYNLCKTVDDMGLVVMV